MKTAIALWLKARLDCSMGVMLSFVSLAVYLGSHVSLGIAHIPAYKKNTRNRKKSTNMAPEKILSSSW